MAKLSLIEKAKAKPKFKSRVIRRCGLCGRPRAVYRKFGICRICLRRKALLGEVPGMRKASW
jgi:small subunit ribosomal protein S14